MMRDSILPRKRFTNDEIIAAIVFLDGVGKLNDDELKARGLQIGDAQKVNHFLSALSLGESTCLPKQAATLLRLTPLLLESGSNTVHHVFSVAVPRAVDAYQKATDLDEKRELAEAIKTAGMVCVDRRLGSIERERRENEFKMFEPFVGTVPAFCEAKARFMKRRYPSERLFAEIGQQPTNAIRMYQWGGRYGKGRSREE